MMEKVGEARLELQPPSSEVERSPHLYLCYSTRQSRYDGESWRAAIAAQQTLGQCYADNLKTDDSGGVPEL
uniref:Uncharacterized protein n=1 Tax=Oscillatoriales cyanobacterium SpSt-402 TaxID=2282168 RepID=A0A832H0L7_9CYAN